MVTAVYGPLGVDVEKLCDRIQTLLAKQTGNQPPKDLPPRDRWSQDDILLITYGDSIVDTDSTDAESADNEKAAPPPLATLSQFLGQYLLDTITGVHILPFFPYSSDDGFAVIDYLQVNPELGTWDDIQCIASQFDLMTDLVMNHVSSKSDWFQQFERGEDPGKDYFITVAPETDVSGVTRPRSHDLLRPTQTPSGEQQIWATFSHDQVDLNFENPDVLIEFLKIIFHYLNTGTK
ncbi:MAG: alpha-amylase family glycosyl hydrolase, partial [Cyanobacteria bacterium J06632_22]